MSRMKTLLLLRHAKSSWKHAGLADHDRPLNKRGRRDAPRIGRLIQQEGLLPDLIVSSTAERARTTAAVVAETAGYDSDIRLTGDLYHAAPEAYLRILRTLPATLGCVLVVGHNPSLEALLSELTGVDEALSTATLAHVTILIETWQELTLNGDAKLVNLWRPSELSE